MTDINQLIIRSSIELQILTTPKIDSNKFLTFCVQDKNFGICSAQLRCAFDQTKDTHIREQLFGLELNKVL